MMKKVTKRAAMVTGIATVLAASALMVPAFAADSASTAAEIVRGGEPDGDVQYPGKEYIIENYEKWDQIAEDYAPEVRQLPNGKLVQRTPTEYECPHWMQQSWTISYNTYYLDADKKGCNSCHADLNETIMNMEYRHAVLPNKDLETYSDVEQCITCHRDNGDEFGRLMHGIHFNSRNSEKFKEGFDGTCESCHTATGDGNGLQLWENVKYDALKDSITTVENVEGNFDFTQDKVQSMDDLYSYDFVHGYYDHMRYACSDAALDLDLPQSMMDEWEITIEGNVPNPYTAKLPDLIAEAEEAGVIVTKASKMVCDWNPVGGGGVTNTEVTGIPVSWLVEKAGGYLNDTTGVRVLRADGSSKRAFPKDKLDDNEALLVYKIGGEYLDATRGYPCTNWVEGVDAQINSKQVASYKVTNEDIDYTDKWAGNPNAWHNENGDAMNKPNATILGIPDGLLIQNGEPFTFNGYVDAYDKKIASMEFSMDQGETWTKFDLPETDVNKMVWWNFTWTPEKEGAYCLTVRATTEEGEVSFETQTVMVNVKDVMPTPEQTTVLETASLVPAKPAATAEEEK